jgi:phosphoserine aminotransferase
VVVIRKDFMAKGRKDTAKILRYSTFAENKSLYNTPPTFAIYLMRNVLAWIEEQGGLTGMERRNTEKAEILYALVPLMSGFYGRRWRGPRGAR